MFRDFFDSEMVWRITDTPPKDSSAVIIGRVAFATDGAFVISSAVIIMDF